MLLFRASCEYEDARAFLLSSGFLWMNLQMNWGLTKEKFLLVGDTLRNTNRGLRWWDHGKWRLLQLFCIGFWQAFILVSFIAYVFLVVHLYYSSSYSSWLYPVLMLRAILAAVQIVAIRICSMLTFTCFHLSCESLLKNDVYSCSIVLMLCIRSLTKDFPFFVAII